MIPPRPVPLSQPRLGLLWFARVAHSWLDALTVKSYQMLLGQFRLPGMRVFVVNDPVWVERMLIAEPHNYPKHRLMHEALEPLLGSSPFTTNGVLWQRQRRMLDQAFGHARLSRVFGLMQQASDDMRSRLQYGTLDVEATMTHVTADIIYRAIFSSPLLAHEADTLFVAFTRYQKLAQRAVFLRLLRLPPLWLNRSRLRQAAIIRGFLAARVRERFSTKSTEDEGEGADILAGLRSALDPQDGSRLSEAEVLDQICMLFLAGHETSASALSWCLYLLAESAKLQQTLRDELAAVTQGEPLQAGDIRKLVQLNALFREVLRLYPPVGYFPREAVADHIIRGKQVRRGDALLVFPWLLHRHRRFWAEPDAFEPGRFGPNGSADSPKGTYLPFGLGARACIGAGFALQEAALILSTLLQHHRLKPEPRHVPKVVGRLTVRSADGIRVRLEGLHAETSRPNDWRQTMVRRWREYNEPRTRTKVLVLGDSHVRVFEHWWFMWVLPRVSWHIVYVPGGTATGLPNPQSTTRARTQFDVALSGAAHDLVVINLGEVDTGYTIWARSERSGVDPRAAMAQAVQRYAAFIADVALRHRVVVVSAPLPTLPDDFVPSDDVGATRKSVGHNQVERTALTLAFNDAVAHACAELGVPHLDDRTHSLGDDGRVKTAWQRVDRADHHYARKTYARWLARALQPHMSQPRL